MGMGEVGKCGLWCLMRELSGLELLRGSVFGNLKVEDGLELCSTSRQPVSMPSSKKRFPAVPLTLDGMS